MGAFLLTDPMPRQIIRMAIVAEVDYSEYHHQSRVIAAEFCLGRLQALCQVASQVLDFVPHPHKLDHAVQEAVRLHDYGPPTHNGIPHLKWYDEVVEDVIQRLKEDPR